MASLAIAKTFCKTFWALFHTNPVFYSPRRRMRPRGARTLRHSYALFKGLDRSFLRSFGAVFRLDRYGMRGPISYVYRSRSAGELLGQAAENAERR